MRQESISATTETDLHRLVMGNDDSAARSTGLPDAEIALSTVLPLPLPPPGFGAGLAQAERHYGLDFRGMNRQQKLRPGTLAVGRDLGRKAIMITALSIPGAPPNANLPGFPAPTTAPDSAVTGPGCLPAESLRNEKSAECARMLPNEFVLARRPAQGGTPCTEVEQYFGSLVAQLGVTVEELGQLPRRLALAAHSLPDLIPFFDDAVHGCSVRGK